MTVWVQSPDSYKLYLKKQLAKYIKNETHLEVAVTEMYKAFLDGVKFGRGKLEVEV